TQHIRDALPIWRKRHRRRLTILRDAFDAKVLNAQPSQCSEAFVIGHPRHRGNHDDGKNQNPIGAPPATRARRRAGRFVDFPAAILCFRHESQILGLCFAQVKRVARLDAIRAPSLSLLMYTAQHLCAIDDRWEASMPKCLWLFSLLLIVATAVAAQQAPRQLDAVKREAVEETDRLQTFTEQMVDQIFSYS